MTQSVVHPQSRAERALAAPGPRSDRQAPRLRGSGRSVAPGLLMLAALVLVAALAMVPFVPPRVAPASAPPPAFSAERALPHLQAVAQRPHPVGSPENARVRDYLLQQLAALGLQPEVQRTLARSPNPDDPRTMEVENVVGRLRGIAPTGAIVLLTHYDSVPEVPGAADNGSGVAVLLELLRALAAGPPLRNDVIALFDDAEESFFFGAQAFIEQHPWMADVRVAVGLDTAVRGPIQVNQTGPRNGWLVQALARAFPGGVWSSASGDGTYEYSMFRRAGIQGLELEDNYAFPEQHTALDRVEIVSVASVQQLGDQALAITRELGGLDLTSPWGEHEVFFSVPFVGLVHYPESWTLPLLVAAGVLLVLTAWLARQQRLASWRGLGAGTGPLLGVAVVSALGAAGLWALVHALFPWENPNWPEVIPPFGEVTLAVVSLLVLGLTLATYRFARRRVTRAAMGLAGLAATLLLAVVLAMAVPGGTYAALWPVLIGSAAWLAAFAARRADVSWPGDAAALLAAAAFLVLVLPILALSYIGQGLASIAVMALVWTLLLGIVLPALDALAGPAPAAKQAAGVAVADVEASAAPVRNQGAA